MKGFYVYLNRDDSKDIHPDNNGVCFTVRLPERVTLQRGQWSCGLFECCLDVDTKHQKTYFICCDIIEHQFVAGGGLPFLRAHNPSTILIASKSYDMYNGEQCIIPHGLCGTTQFDQSQNDPVISPQPGGAPVTPVSPVTPVTPVTPIIPPKRPGVPVIVRRTLDMKYPNIMYIPLRVNEFESITIYLKERDVNSKITTASLISCVLHFKQLK